MQFALKSLKLKLCSKESLRGCRLTMASPWTIFFTLALILKNLEQCTFSATYEKKFQNPPPFGIGLTGPYLGISIDGCNYLRLASKIVHEKKIFTLKQWSEASSWKIDGCMHPLSKIDGCSCTLQFWAVGPFTRQFFSWMLLIIVLG